MKNCLQLLFLSFVWVACSESQDNTNTTQADSTETPFTQVNTQFQETHRPQYHFSPPSKWMNDPNGMVFYKGEYHLFYQHYPDSTVWGPMHWGHAVSKDMIHWEHLPIALYPDSLGYIFSGSAVVDVNNTSGLGTKDNPAMVAIYTYHLMEGEKAGRNDYQTQGIAYSTDNGRTWEKYKGNPVLKNPGIRDFRDPKLSWHEESKQWVLILAVDDHVELYGSKNLTSWSKLSEFGKTYGGHGGVWECPDLFPLEVDGQKKWVMLLSINPGGPNKGSATQYFIGDFDGKTFKSDYSPKTTLWVDEGADNYAGVTWANMPQSDGRRIFLGWMSNWLYANTVPTDNWRSANTIPRELSLKKLPEGIRLISQPVKELASIRGESANISGRAVKGEVDLKAGIPFDIATSELVLELDSISQSKDFGIELSNTQGQKLLIGYEATSKNFYIDRSQSGKKDFSKEFAVKHTAPRKSSAQTMKLHLFFDVASVELFADNGEVVMTDIFFPDSNYSQVKMYAKDGAVKLVSGKATQLKSIWGEKLASAQ
ncbi:glycoside hydrolase family 32 protein [Rhodocytophaga rosea]|uniref:Glycoside hydrolase family 32 protein n=1 Tax=Rhodocytophaga rosea TaxID=2704465 RepID=A0A6C0GLV9_9BACT|nr:glycoside hydrolase family 32 protein [Rhodocytophaga rosea]QHT68927.1 glycoside hydrolase family 32 protein [Rhodocytophaga rosea]